MGIHACQLARGWMPANLTSNGDRKTMAKSKTIVVWGGEDLLSSSIELFLATVADWQVISLSNTEDQRALQLAVETSRPDIVIIPQGHQEGQSDLALQLIRAHPAIKVIMIGLDTNLMDVYSKQKIWVKQSSDLLGVIENEL